MTLPRRVVVLEPNHAGHRMEYCRWISDFVCQRNSKVILATAHESFNSIEFSSRFADITDISLVDLGSRQFVGNWRYQFWVRKKVFELSRIYPDARIVVLEGDKFLPHLLFFPPALARRMTVLVMRAPRQIARGSRLRVSYLVKRLLLGLAARKVRLRVLAPAGVVSSHYEWFGLDATPDPVPPDHLSLDVRVRPNSLQAEASAAHACRLGVFGAISSRKNVTLVIDTMMAQFTPEDVSLRIAGKVSRDYGDRLLECVHRARRSGFDVLLEDRFLTEEELQESLVRTDVVVTAYSTDGPSGIMGRAVACGSLVVAAGAPALKDAVARLNGRGVFVALSADGIAGGVRWALSNNPSVRVPTPLAGPNDFAAALLGEVVGSIGD